MKVIFTAQIYDVKTRCTKSGDRTTRVVIEQDNLATEILNLLNELMNSLPNQSRELVFGVSDGKEEDKL